MKKSSKLQKKDNDEILFSILTDITAAKTTAELLETIFSKLNKVIDFDDVGLFHVLEDGRHRDLAVVTNSNYGANRTIKQNLPTDWLKPEESFNAILDKVQINLVSDFFSSYANHPHLEFLKREKLKQFISSPLERNGETFGVFMLWSKNEINYTTKDIPLFNKIIDFIAVALSNILDRENLAIEKNFKETLLAVSESIASIHDRKELLKVIFEKINPIIPIDDVGLLILDETGTKWKDLAVLDNYHQTMGGKELAALGFTEFLPLDKLTKMSIEHTGIITIEEMIENYSENPFVPIMAKDLKEFLYTPLKVGNTIIGSLFFDSEKSGVYNEGQFPLFKAIADQLAVAVSNVLTNERLVEEKRFSETLLSISESVAAIQNKRQLLKLIFQKLEKIIPFDLPGLFVIDKDKNKFYEVLETDTTENELQEKLVEIEALGPWPYNGHPKEAMLYSKKIGIWNIEEQSKKVPNPQWEHMMEFGLREVLFIPLFYNNKKQGFLCFNKKQEGFYKESDFPLYKAVGDQVSVALNNVLSNEQLLDEKRFSESLLEITEAVAQVNNVKDLYKTIFKIIKPIFPYDELGLFVVDDENDVHYEIITSETFVDSTIQKKVEDIFGEQHNYKHSGSSIKWLMDNGPVALSIVDLDNNAPHPQHKYMIEGGLNTIIGGSLTSGGKTFGMLCFISKVKDYYKDEHLILFKSIAEQIATATSNILSNQQLVEEKNFKETLLKISEAVTNIRDREDLYNTIMNLIQPLIQFDEATLITVDKDRLTFKHILSMASKPAQKNSLYPTVMETEFDISGSPAEQILNGEDISYFELSKWILDYPEFPGLLLMEDLGLLYTTSLKLKNKGEVFAFINFHFLSSQNPKHPKVQLYANIADQLSVAVSNIIANEQLIEEKNFKETLLEISEAVSNVQNRDQLLNVIIDKIQSVIPFDNSGLFIINKEKDIFYELLTENGRNIFTNVDDVSALSGPFSFSGHHKDSFIYLEKVGIYNVLEQSKIYDNPQWEFMLEYGLKKLLVAPLIYGNEQIGFLCLNSKSENLYNSNMFPLITAISSQVSIAVHNVLSNEKLIAEKNFSNTLLHITEAVAQVKDAKDLYRIIFEHIKPAFPYDELGLFVVDEANDIHYELITAADIQQPTAQRRIEDNFGINQKFKHTGTSVEWLMENGPISKNLEELDELVPHPQHIYLMEAGLKNVIGGPLKAGGKAFGMLCFTSYSSNHYKEDHLPLFKSIAEQLSIAVSNILSRHQILEQKRYSEKLLEITEALAAAEDAVQLYNAIDTVVKKLIPFDQVGVLILDKSEEYHYELINEIFVNHISDGIKNTIPLEKQTLYKHKGTSVEWLANNGPVITKMDYLVKNTKHPRHPDMVNAGIKELLGGPIINQGKPIGMLAFKLKEEGIFNEQHIKHYKSVAEQVSICVANILSKKEILWKSTVQNLELKVSNILTDDETTIDKWGHIFQEFKQHIPFTFAIVFKIDEGKIKRFIYDWIAPNEKRQLTLENLVEITKLTKKDIEKAEQELYQLSTNTTDFFNTKKLLPTAVKSLMSSLGLYSLLPFHIAVKKKNTEIVALMFSKQKEQYSIRHINILNGIRNTLRISLENMLSAFDIKEMSEQLKQEKTYLESVVKEAYNFEHMIGDSDAIRDIFNQITEVASVDATTLLLGETGTGKELIARAIHENSNRKNRVLVKVNCAAIPSQIVESELFGHKKGAFTGAIQDRIGKFELANNGTIFLDEIGEMPLELQTKLLRVIQEREVERLGSNEIIRLNIRIIAATNKDLLKEIESGKFRADLYYRLNSFPIMVPPLKARDGDVLLLSDYFARQFSERYGLPFKGFTANSLSRLKRYDWPGNVRELQNLMEQAIISQRGKVLEVYPGATGETNLTWSENTGHNTSTFVIPEDFDMDTIKNEKDKLERAYILQALEKTNWRVSGKNGAARLLDVASTTLESKMKKLGIERNTL